MLLERFLDPSFPSLKVCGVTRADDARELARLNIEALGVNFWPKSKRYVAPADATWLRELKGKILRVGVFVNPDLDAARQLVREGLIDVIQLHGDESPHFASPLVDNDIPFLKAIGVKTAADLDRASEYGAAGVLLDAHAPGVYGGTGETFDWAVASAFREAHPSLPLILAGGIVPENARASLQAVRPAALDVASGSESAPGIKDFAKVAALLEAVRAGF
jgi:phosphoribosylanthranilate isomerase